MDGMSDRVVSAAMEISQFNVKPNTKYLGVIIPNGIHKIPKVIHKIPKVCYVSNYII
jgi:hypothetical protein